MAQASAGSVTDLELSGQGGILQPTLVEIAACLGAVIELLLVESGSLFKHTAG